MTLPSLRLLMMLTTSTTMGMTLSNKRSNKLPCACYDAKYIYDNWNDASSRLLAMLNTSLTIGINLPLRLLAKCQCQIHVRQLVYRLRLLIMSNTVNTSLRIGITLPRDCWRCKIHSDLQHDGSPGLRAVGRFGRGFCVGVFCLLNKPESVHGALAL
jgi:hypothetical protein